MKKFKKLLSIESNGLKFDLKIKLMAIVLFVFIFKMSANSVPPAAKISITVKNVTTQQLVVTGMVTDEEGMPLPGATVAVKGTTTGVVTTFDGDYSITIPDGGNTLVFSSLGFVQQEVVINGQSNINVVLLVDNTSLDEVVVVGYGTQRKKDIAGAISTVKSEGLVLSSSPSIGDVLRGKVSGLQITQNSAQPGGGLDIQIRGAGSINASNDPLIVVDGFPITELQQPGTGNRYNGGTQSILNSFNPNDIESISVMALFY